MSKKILITGATGFIGSYLVKFFTKEGYKVVAHGSSETTINNLIKALKNDNINIENIDFWQQDFLKNDWIFPEFTNVKYIIHTAAATKIREGLLENYDKYFALNVLATKILAKKALEENIHHFIHLSSGQVFGIPPSPGA